MLYGTFYLMVHKTTAQKLSYINFGQYHENNSNCLGTPCNFILE